MVATQTAFDFSRAQAAPSAAPAAPSAVPAVQPSASTKPAAAPVANTPLEAALRAALDLPVRVTLTDNRRTMISLERSARVVHVRLHHMFAQADPQTLQALGAYLAHADRDAAQHIGCYIERHRTSIRSRKSRPVSLSAVGLHHNLLDIYRDVNAQYFGARVEANITWSRDAQPARGRRARSIKLGSYTARDKLIRVHPALDAAFVPRFFVEYIVYHEMLHHVMPPSRAGKRRSLHGPDFQARERNFEQFEAALRWEQENLDRLLSRR